MSRFSLNRVYFRAIETATNKISSKMVKIGPAAGGKSNLRQNLMNSDKQYNFAYQTLKRLYNMNRKIKKWFNNVFIPFFSNAFNLSPSIFYYCSTVLLFFYIHSRYFNKNPILLTINAVLTLSKLNNTSFSCVLNRNRQSPYEDAFWQFLN